MSIDCSRMSMEAFCCLQESSCLNHQLICWALTFCISTCSESWNATVLSAAVVLGSGPTACRPSVVWALQLGRIRWTCRFVTPSYKTYLRFIVFHIWSIALLWVYWLMTFSSRCRYGRLGHRHCVHLRQWCETCFSDFLSPNYEATRRRPRNQRMLRIEALRRTKTQLASSTCKMVSCWSLKRQATVVLRWVWGGFDMFWYGLITILIQFTLHMFCIGHVLCYSYLRNSPFTLWFYVEPKHRLHVLSRRDWFIHLIQLDSANGRTLLWSFRGFDAENLRKESKWIPARPQVGHCLAIVCVFKSTLLSQKNGHNFGSWGKVYGLTAVFASCCFWLFRFP